jgi:probable nitrogen fixation protein
MADATIDTTPDAAADEALLATPFVQQLIKQLRARHLGEPQRPATAEAVHPERGRAARDSDHRRPDPETLWRLELFYAAVAVAIERETRQMVSPMMKMSHEGFGRMVLIAGGSSSSTSNCATCTASAFQPGEARGGGGKFLDDAIEMIRAYPAVAQYGA